jgi:hypothetical protein
LLSWLVVLFFVFQSFSQTNLIVNGDFTDDSGWNDLGQYNDGQATGKIENGAYTIDITAPGTESWSIQFTQTHIKLDSGSAYMISYDLSSSVERTIEVSLSRNGGDYASYSERDTCAVSPVRQHFERTFIMRSPTDTDVRLEFNCGKATGRLALRNVRLVKFTDPLLRVETPKADEQLYAGTPFAVAWYSLNIDGGINVELSVDNGVSWKTIGTTEKNTGSFIWVPASPYSPWCRIRVSSAKNKDVSALNEGPFELAPRREMIINGSFSDSLQRWGFGVYAGRATGEFIRDSAYHIAIENSADQSWQIQLVQNGITLIKGQTYEFSFTAYARNQASIKVKFGKDSDPYTDYIDTSLWTAALSTTPKRYSFLFTMQEQSDSNSRLEFNCGRARTDIYLDDISLVPHYITSTRYACRRPGPAALNRQQSVFLYNGAPSSRDGAHAGGYRMDLKGRVLAGRPQGATTVQQRQAPGIYLLMERGPRKR